MAPMTIDQLPNELIAYILSFIDEPSTFEQRLNDDPAKILDTLDDDGDGDQRESFRGSIKSASLVCHLWRRCVLPILFRHIVWKFQSFNRPTQGQDPLSDVEELEFLRFLRNTGLTRHVKSLAIIIDYPMESIGEDLTHNQHWGILPSHSPAIVRNPELVHYDPQVYGNNWLWHTLFEHLDLLNITLVSSPAILASLLGRTIDLSGDWIFRQRFHILSLSRDAATSGQTSTLGALPSSNPPSSFPPRSVPCDLFSIRDWSTLLMNEGSSVKVYSSYEYFNHAPPSLLPALLDDSDPSMQRLLRSTLRSFSYIAIFPLSTHISEILIPRMPSLDRFYIQIVPRAISFTEADYRHPALDIDDLWMERNTAYAHLVTAVFDEQPTGAWANLQVLETGDTADREAWEQVVRYVVFGSGWRWTVDREGVLVRRPGPSTTLDNHVSI